ncbi:molecular chaperone [Burkholderia contaminans]|uniref:Molecular chaperone n=1 Tax=Burkholderia contaminans TaxID=488447 RepID=A0A3N8PLE8_9BURK|nr:molecular chaperone [Burkholderia contaminans]RQT07626.1 molecular chaperone [Burkholderia contaminans]
MTIQFGQRTLACVLGLCMTHGALAGVVVGATRVILQEDRREAVVPVKNADSQPYVVQAWIDGGSTKGGAKAPFFVTPPLSRLDPGKENLLRVMPVKHGLPSDRESLMWLNVKEIPATPKQDNVLQIAIQTRIKAFYRPQGLTGSSADAPAALTWRIAPSSDGVLLTVNNPTPYHVTFSKIGIEAGTTEDVDLEMVPPLQAATYKLRYIHAVPTQPVTLRFSTINDYGAVTPSVTTKVPTGAV